MDDPEVAKAAEAFDGKGRKVMIVLWKDDTLSICSKHESVEEGDCYVIDPNPANRTLFYVAEAHYSSLGMKIKPLHDEVPPT